MFRYPGVAIQKHIQENWKTERINDAALQPCSVQANPVRKIIRILKNTIINFIIKIQLHSQPKRLVASSGPNPVRNADIMSPSPTKCSRNQCEVA